MRRQPICRSPNSVDAALYGSMADRAAQVVAHQVPPGPDKTTEDAPVVRSALRLILPCLLRVGSLRSLPFLPEEKGRPPPKSFRACLNEVALLILHNRNKKGPHKEALYSF